MLAETNASSIHLQISWWPKAAPSVPTRAGKCSPLHEKLCSDNDSFPGTFKTKPIHLGSAPASPACRCAVSPSVPCSLQCQAGIPGTRCLRSPPSAARGRFKDAALSLCAKRARKCSHSCSPTASPQRSNGLVHT